METIKFGEAKELYDLENAYILKFDAVRNGFDSRRNVTHEKECESFVNSLASDVSNLTGNNKYYARSAPIRPEKVAAFFLDDDEMMMRVREGVFICIQLHSSPVSSRRLWIDNLKCEKRDDRDVVWLPR